MALQTVRFVSRADQLRLRGQRNYSRYMLIVKGFVAGDSLERSQWQKEDAEDARRDAEWKRRHGPVTGVARILPWRTKTKSPRNLTGETNRQQPRRQGRYDSAL